MKWEDFEKQLKELTDRDSTMTWFRNAVLWTTDRKKKLWQSQDRLKESVEYLSDWLSEYEFVTGFERKELKEFFHIGDYGWEYGVGMESLGSKIKEVTPEQMKAACYYIVSRIQRELKYKDSQLKELQEIYDKLCDSIRELMPEAEEDD